jgi:eukaryotic-like serine/threonine-protein kinase
MALIPGTKLGPYEIQSLLGAGGMGEVYRARDTRLQRTVAIKVLPAHQSSNRDRHVRFEQEAKSISALQHPNICVLHDIGSQDGVDFMVMEYVSGQTLEKLIAAGGLATDLAMKYAIQIADALARAHTAGIVHRDLKPANIMVDGSGHIKVLDFGLAKLISQTAAMNDETASVLTMPGAVIGTLPYMSPEQAEGKPLDARSDVFSFGSVLYEMLSGKRAFPAQTRAALLSAVMRDDPKPLSEERRNIPPEVRRVVSRCLKKDSQARYPSAAELLVELKYCRDLLFPESGAILTSGRIVREIKRPRVLIPLALVLILLLAAGVFSVKRWRNIRWAREVAVPGISRFYDQGKYEEAYALAVKAEKAIPDDRTLVKLWPLISYQVSIDSSPSNADVYRRAYGDVNAPWVPVGRTPLKGARQPMGELIWKIEKPGFGTVFRMTSSLFGWFLRPRRQVAGTVALDALDKVPRGMVRVSPESIPKELLIPGYESVPQLPLQDFWIDQFEVTNRQYKAFVDQGGYARREYWKLDFTQDGKSLSWDAAMAQFRDAAGQPGPKNWLQSHYPDGQDDLPVTGVSWYEAAAYAEFAGKSLPTIYHWNRAAGPFAAAVIVPASNFGGNGILPVGAKPGMSPWGNYDMAGNVKEWVWNEAGARKRYVLGGAWDEPNYLFMEPDAQSPFVRAANIGFRCVKYIDPQGAPKVAADPLPTLPRDLRQSPPAPDQLFRVYLGLYSYDKTSLNAVVQRLDSSDEDWTTEKITYTAAYGNEQASAYLLLPKKFKPPLQTVLYFPGDGALFLPTLPLSPTASLDAILRSGRAVLYPVYKGTYERADDTKGSGPYLTSTYRDHVIMWAKDASRAIDYAETRPDLDHQKLAYYGYSWGSGLGGIILAVEPRIRVCVFALGGLDFQRPLPEVDNINFLPRVKQPVLMLNGRYDFMYPVESSQEAFFQLLGSRNDQKKHLLYDTSHNLPRNEFIKETLNWLDQYLGPVQ